MRKFILLIIKTFVFLNLTAQIHIDSLDCYQGFFEYRDVILDPSGSETFIPDSVRTIKIIKANRMIEVYQNVGTGQYSMDGQIISIGFYNGINRLSKINEISWRAKRQSAFVEVFTIGDNIEEAIYYNGFMCDDLGFSISLINRTIENIRIKTLDYGLIQELFNYGNFKEVNYIEDFLNMTVKSICVDQLDVFDSKEGNSIGNLVRNDLVEVIELDGEWTKVKFLKTNAVYWTYASCLE